MSSLSTALCARDVLWEKAVSALPAPLERSLRDAGLADPTTLRDYPRATWEELTGNTEKRLDVTFRGTIFSTNDDTTVQKGHEADGTGRERIGGSKSQEKLLANWRVVVMDARIKRELMELWSAQLWAKRVVQRSVCPWVILPPPLQKHPWMSQPSFPHTLHYHTHSSRRQHHPRTLHIARCTYQLHDPRNATS